MFQAGYCGYNIHNPDQDTIYRPKGSGNYLFLLITSEMKFFFPENGENYHTVMAEPGDCILYTPGNMQYYQATEEFTNSYVHFYAGQEEMEQYQIPHDQLFSPAGLDEISQLLRQIQYEYRNKQRHSEEMLDLLIRKLLIETERGVSQHFDISQKSEIYDSMSSIRVRMLSYCYEDWDMERLCEMAHLGRSQFFYYYKKFFHTSPKDDLLQARIDRAKYLLTNQRLRISEVAEQSGFKNIYHFTRYFRKECGCAPSKYLMQQVLK
ncbi:MAG: AraC family transcriptional regulator [Butyrivibrio sp.]|jgi:AraC-like DNA-binding protein|nr:AraC family transcriptional regulator [Butyrivibrio sp.]